MYMSLVFRGAVEDYEKTGVHPSVFMDGSGDLQIYLCDPIVDDPELEEDVTINNCEVNGGQFSEGIFKGPEFQSVKPNKTIHAEVKD